jgi:cytidylate kinase
MKVITLSRQVGSFGDEVAQLAAMELGFQLVGQPDIHRLGQECDPEFAKACALYEREVPQGFWERFFFDDPAYTSLFESLTYDLASRGDVILLGRGAQVVLLNVRGVMRTRIVAPFDVRAERVAQAQNIGMEEARDFVKRYGQSRQSLIENIYQHDLNDFALYDLIVNTRDMTPDEAAFIVIKSAQNMKPMQNPQERKAWLKSMALAKRVESAIRKKVRPASFSRVEVEPVEGGGIRITGTAPDQSDVEKAARIAQGFEGLGPVDNRMKASRLFHAY